MIYGPAPDVERLDEYTALMAERGIEVRQVYHPAVEIDGEWVGGGWDVEASITARLDDGRLWIQVQRVANEFIAMGHEAGWALQAELLIASLDAATTKGPEGPSSSSAKL